MKTCISIITLLMLNLTLLGQGVNFEHLSFDEALTKAKAENKLLFLDGYTSWCGPCKYMSEKVFPQEEAGKFFNPKFICVKFDMEKGEGPELAKRFGIRAFPTFLIIRPDGSVQHKIVGGGELENFIPRVEKGLNEKTSLRYLNDLYEQGKMNKKQMIIYQIALIEAYEKEKSQEVTKELDAILKDKDKSRKEYWPIIEDSGYGSANFKLVVDNVARFRKNIGKEKVDTYLYNNYNRTLDNCVRWGAKEPMTQVTQIRQELPTLALEKGDLLTSKIEFVEATLNGDVEKIISWIDQENTNANMITIISAIHAIKPKATKEQLGRIAVLGDKFIASSTSETEKGYLKRVFEDLKTAK